MGLEAGLGGGRRAAGLRVDVGVRCLCDDGDAAVWEGGGECGGHQSRGRLGASAGGLVLLTG